MRRINQRGWKAKALARLPYRLLPSTYRRRTVFPHHPVCLTYPIHLSSSSQHRLSSSTHNHAPSFPLHPRLRPGIWSLLLCSAPAARSPPFTTLRCPSHPSPCLGRNCPRLPSICQRAQVVSFNRTRGLRTRPRSSPQPGYSALLLYSSSSPG